MKNRIFVCPICHGMGTIDSLVACNVDDSKRHLLNCICMGLGFVGKKSMCNSCNGKGFRDWIDDVRRPLKEYI